MSNPAINTRRSSCSGSFRDEQKRLKESGKAYQTRKKADVPEKARPQRQVSVNVI